MGLPGLCHARSCWPQQVLCLRHLVVFSVGGRRQSRKDFRDQAIPLVSVDVDPWSGEVLVFRPVLTGNAATSLLVTPSTRGKASSSRQGSGAGEPFRRVEHAQRSMKVSALLLKQRNRNGALQLDWQSLLPSSLNS